MSWFNKKSDPLSERAKALNSEIAALEAQIKKLDSQSQRAGQPRLRSTAVPHGQTIAHSHPTAPQTPPPTEPIFEELDQRDLKNHLAPPVTPEHFNEQGVRKFDVTALLARLKHFFTGTTPANPRFINYLAAGGIQGLQPLRREKRVARNRFIGMTAFLFLILLGIILKFAQR